jgi:carboxyl-terminal processing protease
MRLRSAITAPAQAARFDMPSSSIGRQGIGRRRGVAIGLVLLLISACASNSEGSHLVDQARFAFDPPAAMFAGTYRQIRDYYVNPVTVESLALAGITALDADTGDLTIDEVDQNIRLLDHGVEVSRQKLPDANDAEGWAEVTSAAISAVRAHDPALADATDEQLYQRIFTGITGKLDRFTRYAGRDAAREQKAARDGFGGIGVMLDYRQPVPRIISIKPDGPAARAGIRLNDDLVAIDGISTVGLDEHQINARLRGKPDTRIALVLSRPQHTSLLRVSTMRSLIVPVSVTAERDDTIAIFHIAYFNHDTAKSLSEQFARLQAEPGPALTGIVLDLRGDPGGLLDQAVGVAGMFLNQGEIVSAVGRHPTSMQNYEAQGHDQTRGLPMVVLVNGGTASSAEIVSAALQDEGRAVIVGTSSYGKGTVQMVVTLENAGELTLTWARLVAPSGYILHHHGVIPAFCTSSSEDSSDDNADQMSRILDHGLHPLPGIATQPRASLTDAAWEDLRKSCPTKQPNDTLDLAVAKRLLKEPTLYAQALSLPGIALAHNPDTPAVRSALQ